MKLARLAFVFSTVLSSAVAQDSGGPLAAPVSVAPPDDSVFTNYPRTIHFRWEAVPQAFTYAIEIDCMDCCASGRWCSDVQGSGYIVADLKQLDYTFDFQGNQRGRWRVWAVDAQSQPGFKGAWHGFSCKSAVSQTQSLPARSAPPPQAASPVASPYGPIYSYGPGITVAKAIYSPQPEYSEAARKAKIQGDVVMEAVIGADGTVREAKVLRSLEPSLDANAIRTLKTWRFDPAKKDGNPVAMRVQISTSFRLM